MTARAERAALIVLLSAGAVGCASVPPDPWPARFQRALARPAAPAACHLADHGVLAPRLSARCPAGNRP